MAINNNSGHKYCVHLQIIAINTMYIYYQYTLFEILGYNFFIDCMCSFRPLELTVTLKAMIRSSGLDCANSLPVLINPTYNTTHVIVQN